MEDLWGDAADAGAADEWTAAPTDAGYAGQALTLADPDRELSDIDFQDRSAIVIVSPQRRFMPYGALQS